jgi:His-Xaa-Ser system radical SAM maturase HxsB
VKSAGTAAPANPPLSPLSYRRVGEKFVVTTEAGEFALLTAEELQELVAGRLRAGALRDDLSRRGFLAGAEGLAHTVGRLKAQRSFLNHGPSLHIVVVTLRCDHRCLYCHASRSPLEDDASDLSEATAAQVVATVMQSTNPSVTVEFQGGEPLANADRVRQVADLAIDQAARCGKTLDLSLVTSLSLMTEEMADFLFDRRVQICTSLDGPADLHDALRPRRDGSGHELAIRWIERLNARYRERRLDPDLYHVDALTTVARPSLSRARDIVDEYVRLGLKTIHLRPLNPLGFAHARAGRLGYDPDEYLAFYREALSYLIRKNLDGLEIAEKMASVFLKKIFEDRDPGYLDIRSPCGGAVGQLAYDHDGSVYTCDEGRMLARMGDPSFRVGHVAGNTYAEMVSSPAAKVVCLSSCLEGSPACLACAYRPYCGTCPVLNYSQHGTPFGVIPATDRCRIHKGILDELFRLLDEGGRDVREVLERWTLSRPRPEFVHGPQDRGC